MVEFLVEDLQQISIDIEQHGDSLPTSLDDLAMSEKAGTDMTMIGA